MSPASCSLSPHERDIRWDNVVRGPRTRRSGPISSPSYPSMLGGLGGYIGDDLSTRSWSKKAVQIRSLVLCFERNLRPRVGLDHRPHFTTSPLHHQARNAQQRCASRGKELSLDKRILQTAAKPRNPSCLPYKEEVAGSIGHRPLLEPLQNDGILWARNGFLRNSGHRTLNARPAAFRASSREQVGYLAD